MMMISDNTMIAYNHTACVANSNDTLKNTTSVTLANSLESVKILRYGMNS